MKILDIEKKSTIDEVNIIRAFACLSVIFVHLTAIPVSQLSKDSLHIIIFSFLNRAAKFTTPTFIFLSGFTLYFAYNDRKFRYFSFIKKRFKTTLIPYLIWTLIYYCYFIYEGYYHFNLSFLLEKIVLADMVYHLYFILTITQFYVLFGLFRYLFNRFNPHILLAFFFIVNILFIKYVYFKYIDRFFLNYIFYFALGCYLSYYLKKGKEILKNFKPYILLLYFLIAFYYGYQFYQYYVLGISISSTTVKLTWFVFSFIAILFLYVISIILLEKYSILYSYFRRLSKSSYYIYLSHPLLIFLTEKWLSHIGIISITGRFIISVIIVYGVTLSLSILYSISKEKYLKGNILNVKGTVKGSGKEREAKGVRLE